MSICASAPWYREPWPWLLMAGPAIVVVAGISTAGIAMRSSDGVVADDYYKQGLAINRVLERGRQAQVMGIAARAEFDTGRRSVSLVLASNAPAPEQLRLTLVHPTRAGVDQSALLNHEGNGRYSGRIDATAATHWLVTLEDLRST